MSNTTKNSVLAAITGRLHYLEATALDRARETLAKAGRQLLSMRGHDNGPRVRMGAWTDRVEAIARIAHTLGIRLSGKYDPESRRDFSAEDLDQCRGRAHAHASALLERRLREALLEIKESMALRLASPHGDPWSTSSTWARAGDGKWWDRVDPKFPEDPDAAVIAALACTDARAAEIDLERLIRETVGRLSDGLTWERLTLPNMPVLADLQVRHITAAELQLGDEVLGGAGSRPHALFQRGAPAIWRVEPMRDGYDGGDGVRVASAQYEDDKRLMFDMLCTHGWEKGIQRVVTVYPDAVVTIRDRSS